MRIQSIKAPCLSSSLIKMCMKGLNKVADLARLTHCYVFPENDDRLRYELAGFLTDPEAMEAYQIGLEDG